MYINPKFEINAETLVKHIEELSNTIEQLSHSEILTNLINELDFIDFKEIAFPEIKEIKEYIKSLPIGSEEYEEAKEKLNKLKLNKKHYLIIAIEHILQTAKRKKWGLCKNLDFIYVYNGTHWQNTEKDVFQMFLGEAAEVIGVDKYNARHYLFKEELFKQFLVSAILPTPEPETDKVLINLKNGTFEISPETTFLRPFNPKDFITYQLPFEYNPEAKAPLFEAYLNKVLPDINRQQILAEFLGYVFIKHDSKALKEEKALILYGTGANGKSVFFEIVNALLGKENISSHSLQDLTNENGYYRAKIANKLVNYASEINGKLEASIFKQMVSGEPITARLPYGQPMELRQYAKLIFNCNELPRDVEHTNAYFRRFLIIPFDVTIPEQEQDKQLHTKIIENELSGVFNWVLEGLKRLLEQKRFTDCEAVNNAIEQYKLQSDSVKLFIEENEYKPCSKEFELIKTLYNDYRTFCLEDGFKPLNKSNFIKRLQNMNIVIEKRNIGNVAFITKEGSQLPY